MRGQRGRKVAVLLTPEMTTALSLLVSKRQECGVEDTRTDLFGIPQCQSRYRGQDCRGSCADLCGAEHPANLRSTNLWKHVATVSQVMNLEDNELDQLADFLGRDIRVHREFCHLPQSTVQVAKISELLMAMEKGSLTNIQGKSLDQTEDEVDMTLPVRMEPVQIFVLLPPGQRGETVSVFLQLDTSEGLNSAVKSHSMTTSNESEDDAVNFLMARNEEFERYFPTKKDPRTAKGWIRDPVINKPGESSMSVQEEDQLLDIANHGGFKSILETTTLPMFWIKVMAEYPQIATTALKTLLPFPTTYLCEAGFPAGTATKTRQGVDWT
ncbi:hypothetical protein MHYP_G00088800 [Metynnis hypsauchen]